MRENKSELREFLHALMFTLPTQTIFDFMILFSHKKSFSFLGGIQIIILVIISILYLILKDKIVSYFNLDSTMFSVMVHLQWFFLLFSSYVIVSSLYSQYFEPKCNSVICLDWIGIPAFYILMFGLALLTLLFDALISVFDKKKK